MLYAMKAKPFCLELTGIATFKGWSSSLCTGSGFAHISDLVACRGKLPHSVLHNEQACAGRHLPVASLGDLASFMQSGGLQNLHDCKGVRVGSDMGEEWAGSLAHGS